MSRLIGRLNLLFPYLVLAGVTVWVAAGRWGTGRTVGAERMEDPVCHMEVDPSWTYRMEYEGKTYTFCTKRCLETFAADPQRYVVQRCLVCSKPVDEAHAYPATYLDHTYFLCSAAHRATFKADPASFFMHTMWGIPSWLYYVSIGVVLVLSFGLFDYLGGRAQASDGLPSSHKPPRRSGEAIRGEGERLMTALLQTPQESAVTSSAMTLTTALPVIGERSGARVGERAARSADRPDRFDLLSIPLIGAAFRSRVFRFVLQAVVVALFLLIIAAGLWGHQNPALNIAPILTWTIWWGMLIILILFAGKAWCYVCPWDALAGWTEKLSFWRKQDEGLSLRWKWPRAVRNISIATILFVGLTWIELGFGVTMRPRVTAYLAIAMLLMAVVAALLFDRKSFCRYGCLVGRVSGLYALFASTEVRARDKGICKSCRSKECVRGSDTAYGCPTMLYPGGLEVNTYCIQCMECIQACPHDNLTLNLRPWGTDLAARGKPRADEAYLALLMLAITGFHGLTMTPMWRRLVEGIQRVTSWQETAAFSLGMALLMLTPVAVYAVLVGFSKRLGDSAAASPLRYRDYFVQYAYALLPIALFYHIAHNLEHLLMEGPKVVAMISDPLGRGWNLFGTAGWRIPPLISLDRLWIVQVFLVLLGHVYSLWVAQKTSLRLFGSTKAARRSQIPMLVGMIAFSVFSLWLLKQPMEMRTSAM